jgi:NAD(P)-dependent dehydrogenase (short-subunit alcohol dehydrogenase family)
VATSAPTRTALVTGANRGIGLEVCRQLSARGLIVVLTSRDPEAGLRAVASLGGADAGVVHERLDVADPFSVFECARRLEEAGTHIDILVNNAAVYPRRGVLEIGEALIDEAMDINLLGPWRTARSFMPGMIQRGYGRVVNVSSGNDSMSAGLLNPAAYAVSKVGLNALTIKLAEAAGNADVKVNAVCPGWVRTQMGGDAAPRSVQVGAEGVTWAATLPEDGPTGGFFRDGEELPW